MWCHEKNEKNEKIKKNEEWTVCILEFHRDRFQDPSYLLNLQQIYFFINSDIDFTSYADDTTPYICGQNFSEVINFLESNITNVFKWCHEYGLMADSSKGPYETKSIQI